MDMTFNFQAMKRLFNKALIGCMAVCATALYGCTEFEEVQRPGTDTTNDKEVTRITVGLHGATPDSKLTYEEATVAGAKVMKTYWSEEDVLVANPHPGNADDAYTFNLIEGEGTGVGVFECSTYPSGWAPEEYPSNAWTIYFPGDRFKQESDFLNFRYDGQKQTGNGNMDHLKDYHTIRLCYYSDKYTSIFSDDLLDISGENLEESGCMKFNLSGLPSGVEPTELTLSYINPNGRYENVFYIYNTLSSYFGSVAPKWLMTSSLSMELEGFEETTSVTAYMMLSNGGISVAAGGKFRVTVNSEDGKKYSCEKPINSDVTLLGGRLHSITCTEWTEKEGAVNVMNNIDGFDNPEDGVVVLHEASIGTGTDIIIMGDGFAGTEAHFGTVGDYRTIMTQAYEDFFSVEPYKTLKPYFNVYYINAVSEEDHDASPLMNGATQGTALTVFNTQFTEHSTSIYGNNAMVLQYAMQAIRAKGGKGGTAVTDENEIMSRAYTGLSMVMINVACHAGTCTLSYSRDTANDFGNSYSIAYTSLGTSDMGRRWTTIHEAGGHGFGKLGDEYGYDQTTFKISSWEALANDHTYGIHRNVNEYWDEESAAKWTGITKDYTSAEDIYWYDLLSESYDYAASEGLGAYKGAYTYNELFCRPTENSVMRNQFDTDGQFFNAISRWAIWYRLMRLTGGTEAAQFKESLDAFITFDETLTITKNEVQAKSASFVDGLLPTAPPVLIEGCWENGRFITE